MPKGDRTGPQGDGPTTGRQMGYCKGNEKPGITHMHPNRGGMGRRHMGDCGRGKHYQGRFSDDSDETILENEIRILKDRLSWLEGRLSKIREV